MTYSRESVDRKRAAVGTLLILCAASVASCSSTASFSGTYVGNEAASVMPPGQKVPPNFRLVIEDDGVAIKTVQTFIAASGEAVQLVWQGECDGKERPVVGAAPPGIQLSCRRSSSGALINTVSSADWSYVETCVLDSKVRMTCKGSMLDEKGEPLPFSYAFDREE